MTARPDLKQWRSAGRVAPVDTPNGPVSVFRRVAGPASGDWTVLLHGWPTSSWDWAAVAPAIEETGRTLAFDWPGLGASQKGPEVRYDIDALTDVFLALCAQEGVGAARIVCHDVGTIVAQELLARDLDGELPLDIVSVTWLNGSIYPDRYRPTETQLALADPELGPVLVASVNQELYGAGLTAVHHPDHQPDQATLIQHWEAFGREAGASEMPRFLAYIGERAGRAARLVSATEAASVPMRFIWGEADEVSGSAQAELIRTRFGPDVDLVAFEDCAHYPHAERPDDVAAHLVRAWD